MKNIFLIVFLTSHAFAVFAGSFRAALPKQAVSTLLVGHAIDFQTWRSLARQGNLDDSEVAELMVRLARAV